MFKIGIKLIISVTLLSSDFLSACSQSTAGATTENVVVTIKGNLNPEGLAAAFNRDNLSETAKGSAKPNVRFNFARTARAKSSSSTKDLFICAISMDASCLMDHVEDIVDNANYNLLDQADAEARRLSVGREDSEDEDATPSSLITSIAQLLLEVPGLLKDSLGGMLRADSSGLTAEEGTDSDTEEEDEEEGDNDDADDDGADDSADDNSDDNVEDDDDEDETEEDHQDKEVEAAPKDDANKMQIEDRQYYNPYWDGRKKCGKKKGCVQGGGGGDGQDDGPLGHFSHGTTGREVGDARGKKKKKKKAIIKLLLLGLIIKAKITLLLKLLAAGLQVKFLLIALANLLLNFARFWWDLKKSSHHEQPQKVIYYEHAQHQHHYDGSDDWQSSPGGGGYWGRAYESGEDTDGKTAQDMAYAKHLPKGTTYSRVEDKPNISWNPWG